MVPRLSQGKATEIKHVFIFKGQYMGLVLLYIYIDSSLVALILKGKTLLTSLQNYSCV
jgi:hypothetical protein